MFFWNVFQVPCSVQHPMIGVLNSLPEDRVFFSVGEEQERQVFYSLDKGLIGCFAWGVNHHSAHPLQMAL